MRRPDRTRIRGAGQGVFYPRRNGQYGVTSLRRTTSWSRRSADSGAVQFLPLYKKRCPAPTPDVGANYRPFVRAGKERVATPQRAYLSWDEIRQHFLGRPNVTIVNHGTSHGNLAAMTEQEIRNDVIRSTHSFEQHLGVRPRFFAVPFGNPNTTVANILENVLMPLGYRGVLWVKTEIAQVSTPCNGLLHLNRIHAPAVLGDWPRCIRRFVCPW